jgi:hypothetical protein
MTGERRNPPPQVVARPQVVEVSEVSEVRAHAEEEVVVDMVGVDMAEVDMVEVDMVEEVVVAIKDDGELYGFGRAAEHSKEDLTDWYV